MNKRWTRDEQEMNKRWSWVRWRTDELEHFHFTTWNFEMGFLEYHVRMCGEIGYANGPGPIGSWNKLTDLETSLYCACNKSVLCMFRLLSTILCAYSGSYPRLSLTLIHDYLRERAIGSKKSLSIPIMERLPWRGDLTSLNTENVVVTFCTRSRPEAHGDGALCCADAALPAGADQSHEETWGECNQIRGVPYLNTPFYFNINKQLTGSPTSRWTSELFKPIT